MDDRPAEYRDTADFLYARLRRSQYSNKDLTRWGEYFTDETEWEQLLRLLPNMRTEGSPWMWADQLLKIMNVGTLPG